MKQLIFAVIVTLLLIGTAQAELLVKDYNKVKDAEWFKIHIHGVGVGYLWANAHLHNLGQAQLYCQTRKLALTPEQYANILHREITEHPDHIRPDDPVEMILLYALQRTFPCQEGGKP